MLHVFQCEVESHSHSLDVGLGTAPEHDSCRQRATGGSLQDRQCCSDNCSLWSICYYSCTGDDQSGTCSCVWHRYQAKELMRTFEFCQFSVLNKRSVSIFLYLILSELGHREALHALPGLSMICNDLWAYPREGKAVMVLSKAAHQLCSRS